MFENILDAIYQSQQSEKTINCLKNQKNIFINGLAGSFKSFFLKYLCSKFGCSIIYISQNSESAEKIFEDYLFLNPKSDLVFFQDDEYPQQRITALNRINNNTIFFASLRSIAQKTISKRDLESKEIHLKDINRDCLVTKLADIGYKRVDIVEEPGEFAARGGIVDIFGPGMDNPVRVDYYGDQIESIRTFSISTQLSIEKTKEITVFPHSEEKEVFVTEYFDTNSIVFIDGQMDILDDNFKKSLERFYRIESSLIPQNSESVNIPVSIPENYNNDMARLENDIKQKTSDGFAIVLVSTEADRLKEVFQGADIIHGALESGFIFEKIMVLTDKEIFGKVRTAVKYKPSKEGVNQYFAIDFDIGDFVVHSNYGICIYNGLKKISVSDTTQEYILLEFADEDYLYVMPDQMKLVNKYVIPGDAPPKLNKLRDKTWARTKKKVKESTQELAKDLMELYTAREREEGFVFPPDTVWQNELENSFEYEETLDQQTAAAEIKKDMESGRPMERLLCGDVGYGKTEVALRAAFKATSAGKQVAVLVPTTILAEQHYNNFKERIAPFPFVIEMLSRFRTKSEQKQILASVAGGGVDILIGTHRLLQNDIVFKDLGLLIIDEEQRFGVKHKEKLKKLKKNVDILSLTATPIPRTLYMALSGIREMSVINTPPSGRSSVETVLSAWDKQIIKKAILRELERGGQIFFVHNFIRSIDQVTAYLKKLVPEAKIFFAHGQMRAKDLEDIISRFLKNEFNILVCTSIIESGLDMPNVNTIIIDHAERFGLADLYQLRGRVGRSNVKAFAYLLYKPGDVQTEEAMQRLAAIKDFTQLGSGYKIAMRDLEIRGAGNLLGREQSGHVAAVGFDLYTEMLKESVDNLKGIKPEKKNETVIDIGLDVMIPDNYIEDEKQRISCYKRMYNAGALFDLDELRKEIIDRFGKMPQKVTLLFELLELKIEAANKGIKKIQKSKNKIYINGKISSFSGEVSIPGLRDFVLKS